MHFDEASSSDSPAFDSAQARPQAFGRISRDTDDGEPPRREGLPPAFRMRHGLHYVEQLMGDEPVQTVRRIPIGEIDDAAPERALDVGDLETSIRTHGILLPLFVARTGARYVVIDGAARLRAAIAIGLDTVPCVLHGDADAAEGLRRELTVRQAPAPIAVPDQPRAATDAVLGELKSSLGFAASLLEALTRAGHDRLRATMITELLGTELEKGAALVAAAEAAAGAPSTATLECRAVIEGAVAGVSREARLRGIAIQLSPGVPCAASVRREVLQAAISGILHGLLTLGSPGQRITVGVANTAVRPALIVEMALDCRALSGDAMDRFFDRSWTGHPSGAAGALMLASAAQAAKAHGGRVSVRTSSNAGCVVAFVLPTTGSAAGC